MVIDDGVLAEVEAARDSLDALEDAAWTARARFHQWVRQLHAAGGSMREIATALGMSHQRVHQIIGEDAIVEVDAPAKDVTPHPSAMSITATADKCTFCGATRRDADK